VAALSVVVLCAGCTKPQPAHPDRWARAWIDSLNSRRLQQVAALFTPDATYEDPLSGGERSGPTLAFLFAFAFYGFPNAHYELGRVTADKDRLAVEWKATGLSRVRNQPPVSGVFIIQLQGDAIASVRGYFDASGLH
jgi:limonene-1,2-epoxide hydrolase